MEYIRKVSLGSVIVFYREGIWLQFMILTLTSTALIIIAGFTNPQKTTYERRMERFNEVKLIFIMYHIICFTDFLPDPETTFLVGYSCILFVVGGLIINSFTLVTAPFKILIKWCKIRYAKKIALK